VYAVGVLEREVRQCVTNDRGVLRVMPFFLLVAPSVPASTRFGLYVYVYTYMQEIMYIYAYARDSAHTRARN